MASHNAGGQASSIRVLVVDDQEMMRELLKEYAGTAEDVEVVGLASNGKDCVEQVFTLHPDVVLMDIEMPEMDGIAATQMLMNRKSTAKVLVVSASYNDRYLAQALRNGAMGYLLKTTSPEELVAAIRGVHGGSLQFGSGVLQRELSSLSPGAAATPSATIASTANGAGSNGRSGSTSSSNKLAAVGDRPADSNSSSSTVIIDVAANKRPRSKKRDVSSSARGLEIELSRIRAGYWVLRTELQMLRRWVVGLSIGLAISLTLLVFFVVL